MEREDEKQGISGLTRRDFIKTSALTAGLAVLTSYGLAAPGESPAGGPAKAGSTDVIRVGVIGCGGRGTGAAGDCLASSENVEIVALGDLFKDRLDGCLKELRKGRKASSVKVTDETCFVGFDAYKKVLAVPGVNMVILATPPHFRPEHLRAAIEAGKNVFMEKPVAVDPAGIRIVIEASEQAKAKGLGIVAGTQRRHQTEYIEVMKRIHDGAIGEIVAAQCYWNQGGLWVNDRQPAWTDMETQCRNWLYYTWLSGDHIVEQHVHNLDVVNWALGATPVKCMGMGGRQVRTEPQFGNIFDHFAIEYEYPNGARVMSMCRQIEGSANRVGERIVGTKGIASPEDGEITGEKPYRFEGRGRNPYVQEHTDLIASIRSGKPLNEGRTVAESTMNAIIGRMSTYTGRELKWDWAMNASKLRLGPEKYEFGPLPVEEIAVPGKTKLI